MTRTTIDFGIDLGTTNSSIAVLNGMEVTIFKNNEGSEYTPSVVWCDKKNRIIIGREAKSHSDSDPENTFAEFKLQMGTAQKYTFKRGGLAMKPDELSAEVLKSLKGDVKQRSDEDVKSAVITVPAAFELPQCEATKKAAQLAGFVTSPLLQEPVAAAMAYGFQSDSDKVFWLVYDFGGGTFDAAIIHLRDGIIQVVNHEGDNHLGGKLIDWAIVDELLIPALTQERRLTDFRRGNVKWIPAIAKLKLKAEEAKIRLSREEYVPISMDALCQDDRGEVIDFDFELKRIDVEKLVEPFILRSINICKKALAEKRLSEKNIEKLILVGGPTLMPYLRQRLADPKDGLGIPLEFSIDSLTVVAQGAAIFAGTQRNETVEVQPIAAGQYRVELENKPVGPDTEPLIGGKVVPSDSTNLAGFTIEFINNQAQPPWRSGRIGLAPDGSFMTTLWAEKWKQNIFQIELCDEKGTKQETVPNSFPYTPRPTPSEHLPLIHSVGIALVSNEVALFFEKGVLLPTRKLMILHTALEVRQGQTGDVIRIPVLEGEKKRADRNHEIGALEVRAEHVKRNVPAGSEVEITVEIDASRLVRLKTYIPILDEEFEHVLHMEIKTPEIDILKKEFEREKERLEQVRTKVQETRDQKAQQALQRIDGERIVHDISSLLAAAPNDPDAALKCKNRLLDLKAAIDEVEDALECPVLKVQAEKDIEFVHKIINDPSYDIKNYEKDEFTTLEKALHNAVRDSNVDELRFYANKINQLAWSFYFRHPGSWVNEFENLEKRKSDMRDQSQAELYFTQGRRAINDGNVEGLKSAVRQLWNMLPIDDEARKKISGVMW
ncbi:MAG: Hsp70 family protein [Bacteroidota bacterium]|nr:Hsp70 family protein [Bacteroidota bacterium]